MHTNFPVAIIVQNGVLGVKIVKYLFKTFLKTLK